MERMYQKYKDVAEFYLVYISEAHASDDKYPVEYAKEKGIKEHTNYGERCSVAGRLQLDKKLTIPCLVDGMDNAVEKAYKGWPDRLYVVGKDGKLAVASKRGPWGYKPALKKAQAWLASYKKTGQEPELALGDNDEPDFGAMQMELYQALRKSDYKTALNVATELHRLDPEDVGTMYNTACIHCLRGNKKQAYSWLEKGIDGGYSDADHLLTDEDFKTVRDEQRFKDLVKRAREKSSTPEKIGTSPDTSASDETRPNRG